MSEVEKPKLELYKKRETFLFRVFFSAEAARFELAVQFPVRQFSKLVVSATHPHLLMTFFLEIECKCTVFFQFVKRKSKKFAKNGVYLCCLFKKTRYNRLWKKKRREIF